MYFKAIALVAFCATQALGLDFSNSKWIWTNEVNTAGNAPVGTRAFRRDYYTPQGQTALSANIIIVADNSYTLWVNGNKIGSGSGFPGGSVQTQADGYCIRLDPDCNIFAVNATNAPSAANPAGLLAAIQIRYTDGFSETIVTDEDWHAFTSVPDGFQNVAFDDSAWPRATVETSYGGNPWGTVGIPSSATTGSTTLQLTDAQWIWTNELDANKHAPLGGRAFRKNVVLPSGQRATSATIVAAADDNYSIYVNGKIVGSAPDALYGHAQRYVVDITPPASEVLIAVYGVNTHLVYAGFIAAVQLTMEDCECGSITSFVTDSTWKFNLSVPPPAGYVMPGFDDSKWLNAVEEGAYGSSQAPFAKVPIDAKVSPGSAPLPNAPAAPAANVIS